MCCVLCAVCCLLLLLLSSRMSLSSRRPSPSRRPTAPASNDIIDVPLVRHLIAIASPGPTTARAAVYPFTISNPARPIQSSPDPAPIPYACRAHRNHHQTEIPTLLFVPTAHPHARSIGIDVGSDSIHSLPCDGYTCDYMTEFATYPAPLTFMPMPAITMASHRPKRKSGTKTNLEDAAESTRGEDLPPLKKTRRASPDRPVDPAPAKTRMRTTRSSAVVENDDSGGGDNIFSKGPSRAKRAKQSQKEKKQEAIVPQAQQQLDEPLEPQTTGLRSTSRQAARSPTRTRQSARTTEPAPRAKGVENERPIPTHANGKHATAGRKPKAQNFETPERKPSRVRRSPRLNAAAAPVEARVETAVESEKPLTVPLAAIEDTPLVRRRNKEMREANGHRRSSLGLRGRRASSLTNGHIAAPHPDVQPQDFFKHLDAQMIEIQRMQQLLAWCSKCALSEKRARGRDAQSNARAAARVIEEDILADLTEKKLNVNWWESSEGTENAEEVPKKPHPKNEDHKRKIAALEQQLEQLNKEKQAWIDISEMTPARLPKSQREGTVRPASLDASLLRPQEVSVIPGFEESDKVIDTIERVMSEGRESIEFRVDQFSHGMHRAQQYSRYAKSVSEGVLAQASSVLDMRAEAAKKAAGTSALPLHEVLKSISHLDRG